MSDAKPLNLRQKLVEIYKELDHVEKGGYNKKQNYSFVRAADVLRSIREMFAKYGIYAETNFELLGTYDIKTNSGGTMHAATVKATIVMYDCDSDETKTISGLGDGADGGDKGVFKAQTGATKNALRNGTLLPDEADPEADENVDQQTAAEPYQHPVSTFEMPEYSEPPVHPTAPVARPATQTATAARPTSQPVQSTETPQLFGAPDADVQLKTTNAQAVAPERGDAWEEPEIAKLPTEAELVAYRNRFVELSKDLSTKGNLTASKGLKANVKLRFFLQKIEGVETPNDLTTSQWEDFFTRVNAAVTNPEVGLVGLAKMINAANGIEPKK